MLGKREADTLLIRAQFDRPLKLRPPFFRHSRCKQEMPERDAHLYGIRISLEGPLVPLPRMFLILLGKVDMPDGEKRALVHRKLSETGLLLLACGPRSIRFRPALNLSAADTDAALDIVRRTLKQL